MNDWYDWLIKESRTFCEIQVSINTSANETIDFIGWLNNVERSVQVCTNTSANEIIDVIGCLNDLELSVRYKCVLNTWNNETIEWLAFDTI